VYRTIIGLLLAALTGVVFYFIGRTRYKCPHCGRKVKWSDELCPHCGDDMKFQHRVGTTPRMMKPPLIVHPTSSSPPSRRRSSGKPRGKR
jgi:endogenous inhibitor of DNA gyrase (YacG/DUF329 family)